MGETDKYLVERRVAPGTESENNSRVGFEGEQ
jgi:hypothetical protein